MSHHVFLRLAGALFLTAPLAFGGESLSFSEGRALSRERDAVLLVLVHGSDWNPFGEQVFEYVWKDAAFAEAVGVGIVLADVDVLQDPGEKTRRANAERNEGWVKKDSGLRTYPAVLAYAPDGSSLGVRQGRDFPKTRDAARFALLELVACCRTWKGFDEDLAAAREAGDAARELDLLIVRDRLPLRRVAGLLDEVNRLDPEDEAGHLARLTFPSWNALVKQATDEARAGQGAEAERRLREMLANPAYTEEQRGVIHLALGSVYRRWEGHESQASASFEAAWRAAPESVCGRAGMRLYLRHHGGPSLVFGWGDRHTDSGESEWTIEDFSTSLEPGTYRLRLRWTHGGELGITRVRLLAEGQSAVVDTRSSSLTKDSPLHECELTVVASLTGVTLSVAVEPGAASRGSIEWTKLR